MAKHLVRLALGIIPFGVMILLVYLTQKTIYVGIAFVTVCVSFIVYLVGYMIYEEIKDSVTKRHNF